MSFTNSENDIWVELRDKSLIGEIVSLAMHEEHFKDNTYLEKYKKLFTKRIKPYLGEELLNKTDSLVNENKEFIKFDISESPILGTRIIDFCKKNGIMNPFKKSCTFRELLLGKSNDFSVYESLFNHLTNVDLLSNKTHCNLNESLTKTLSIIIPCYNSHDTINKVLFSIQNQKLPSDYLNKIEVVIIDDNSKFPTSDHMNTNDYNFIIKNIRLNINHGVSHARELGVIHSSGDILIFLDSDVILSQYYLADHIIRNIVINNAVFVSFKENISRDDHRIEDEYIESGVQLPTYHKDLRISKKVKKGAIGTYKVEKELEIHILEETNFFKDFYGSRTFGVYDLSCMVTGHNFSVKRELILASSPFTKTFQGWGMEDVYFGLKMISNGNYIIPVLSCGVLHIEHSPRSGSDQKRIAEYKKNTDIINDFLDSIVG